MLRPNLAMDAPPTEISVGGVPYAANVDYRVWLQVLALMKQIRSETPDRETRLRNARIFGEIETLVFGGRLRMAILLHRWGQARAARRHSALIMI